MTKNEAQIENILTSSRNILTIAGSSIIITATLLKELIIISGAPGFNKYLPLLFYTIGWLSLCITIYLYYIITNCTIKCIDSNDIDRFDKPKQKIQSQLIIFIIGLVFILLGLCCSTILKSKYPANNIQTIKILENEK